MIGSIRFCKFLSFFLLNIILAGWFILPGGEYSSAFAQTDLSSSRLPEEPPTLVVLMYHRVGDGRYPSTNISVERLVAHIDQIRESGGLIVSLRQGLDILSAFMGPDPESQMAAAKLSPDTAGVLARLASEGGPLVAVTIDDAYQSVFNNAWPVFKAREIPFTLFVSTGLSDSGAADYMTWAQLRVLSESPLVSFGGHAHNHGHMANMTPETARSDIALSQKRLQEELGVSTDIFAYPYGEISLSLMETVEDAGYLYAFGQHSGAIGLSDLQDGWTRHTLPRFPLSENFGDDERLRTILSTRPFPAQDRLPKNLTIGIAEGDNPPAFGFTVRPSAGGEDLNLERLRCYVSGGNMIRQTQFFADRVEIRFEEAFDPGRTRINCTVPASGGGWHWLGTQFYRPPASN